MILRTFILMMTLLSFELSAHAQSTNAVSAAIKKQKQKSKKEDKKIKAPSKVEQSILPGLVCDPKKDNCVQGSCRKLIRHTDVNLCQTEGKSCKDDKECCSLKCDKKSKTCDENYRCVSCKSIGNKVVKGFSSCCPGLYPNKDNICIPIYPIFMFNDVDESFNKDIEKEKKKKKISFKSILIQLIETAKADEEEEAFNEAKEEAEQKLNQIILSHGGDMNGPNDSNDTEVSGSSALRSYFQNKINAVSEIVGFQPIMNEMDDFVFMKNAISQAMSTVRTTIARMSIPDRLKDKLIRDNLDRVIQCSGEGSYDQTSVVGFNDEVSNGGGVNIIPRSVLQNCLSFVNNIQAPTMDEMGMIQYIMDGTIPDNVFVQGFMTPRDDLYAPMFREDSSGTNSAPGVNIPFRKRPEPVLSEDDEDNENEENQDSEQQENTPKYTFEKFGGSDFKTCRINLFADYMTSQSDQYYEGLFTFLALDYVTSGQGVVDKMVVGQWKRHIQSLDENYEDLDINFPNGATARSHDQVAADSLWGVPLDRFDEYNEAVEANINDYFQNSLVNSTEQKIFKYLFSTPYTAITDDIKDKIKAFYMYENTTKTSELESALGNPSIPPASEFSLFHITRFEAVKYKMSLYKLMGKFAKESLKLTCRCVDVNGPVNGDSWLEDDVKETYLNYCNDIGKYNLYRMSGSNQSIQATRSAQEQTNTNLSGRTDVVRDSSGLNSSVSDTQGQDVVNQTQSELSQNINQDGSATSNGQFGALSNIEQTDQSVSRYDDWVKVVDGETVLSFDAYTKENPQSNQGLGHGIYFQEMMWQMAMAKTEILMEVASENIFSVSQGLQQIKMFLMTFNWGYTKTKLVPEIRRRKIGCISMIVSMFKQLFGHREMNFGTDTEWDLQGTNLNYRGTVFNRVEAQDVMSTFELRPSVVCNKQHFKRKTKICKRYYYYKCVKNVVENNDVCNRKLPVGMCVKSAYAYQDFTSQKKFIIDPFVPAGVNIPKPNDNQAFYKTLSITDFRNSWVNDIKAGASRYLAQEFFGLTGLTSEQISEFDEEMNAFGEFTFRYIFYYPKMASRPRYMTEGLIPFYDRLIWLSMQMGMGMMMDLNNAAFLALQLEDSYVNVVENENLFDVTKFTFNGFEDIPFTFSSFNGGVTPSFVTSIPNFQNLNSLAGGFSNGSGSTNGVPGGSIGTNDSTPSDNTFSDLTFSFRNNSRSNLSNSGLSSGNGGSSGRVSDRNRTNQLTRYARNFNNFRRTVRNRFDQRENLKDYMQNNKRSKELAELEKRAKQKNDAFKNALSRSGGSTRNKFRKNYGNSDILNNGVGFGSSSTKLTGGKGLKNGLSDSAVNGVDKNKLDGDANSASNSAASKQYKELLNEYLNGNAAKASISLYDLNKLESAKDKELDALLNGAESNSVNVAGGVKLDANGNPIGANEGGEDFIDLDDIDDTNLEGFSFGTEGEVISKKDLVKYFKDKGMSETEAVKLAEEEIRKREMSLFQIVTRRYIRSAYPRFLFLRKKKGLK